MIFPKNRPALVVSLHLSKVQSVDQRMRPECGVGFRQLRTCRRTRPGQLCATSGLMHRSKNCIIRSQRIGYPAAQMPSALAVFVARRKVDDACDPEFNFEPGRPLGMLRAIGSQEAGAYR